MQLLYITLHYTNYIAVRYNYKYNYNYTALHNTTLLHCITLQLQLQLRLPLHYTTLQLQLQLHYFTLHHTRLHYTIPHYSTQHYTTLHLHYTIPHYITLHYAILLITPHHDYNCNCTCNYTTLHYNYNSTTRHYNYNYSYNCATTALHHTTSSSCGGVTTATIATTPNKTTPTTCRSISGFALPSVIHNNQPLLPVVPHKAVAEVSKIGNLKRRVLLWRKNGRAKPLIDRKVVVCFLLTARWRTPAQRQPTIPVRCC